MRVLVTAGRDWWDVEEIERALYRVWCEETAFDPGMVVVQGGAPGGDAIAAAWASTRCRVEEYKAEWGRACDSQCTHRPMTNRRGDRYCPRAGHIRNQTMLDTGIDLCLAFPMPKSRGTWDMVRRCRQAGVRVRIYRGHERSQQPPKKRIGL